MTKEIQAIDDALRAYYEKHNGNVVINASILAFNKDNEVIDGHERLWQIGEHLTQLTNVNVMMEDVIHSIKEEMTEDV